MESPDRPAALGPLVMKVQLDRLDNQAKMESTE